MISLWRYVDKINREASVDDKLAANVETIFQLIRRKASVDAFRATIDEFADLVVMHVSPMEHDPVVMRGAVQAAMERFVSCCLMRDGRNPPRIDESERALVGDLLDTLRLDEGAALDATTVDYGESVLDAVVHSTNLFTASRTSDENGRPPPIATTPPLLGGGGRYNGHHPEQWKVRAQEATAKWRRFDCRAWEHRQKLYYKVMQGETTMPHHFKNDDFNGDRCVELIARVNDFGRFNPTHRLNNAQSDELFRQCLVADGTEVDKYCANEPTEWGDITYNEGNQGNRGTWCRQDTFKIPAPLMDKHVNAKLEQVHNDTAAQHGNNARIAFSYQELGKALDNTARQNCRAQRQGRPWRSTRPEAVHSGRTDAEIVQPSSADFPVYSFSNIVTVLAVVQAIRHFFRKTHRRQRAKAMLEHTLHSVFGQ
jgi:hypothetical protein